MLTDGTGELGPIDWSVVEFPNGHASFSGQLGIELASLVDAEFVQILDLLVVTKSANGVVDVIEFADMDDQGELNVLNGQFTEVLGLDDVELIAEVLAPGSVAGVLVWSNSWAVPFAVAARRSGGELIASGRIATRALSTAVGTDTEAADTPIRAGRKRRPGVISHPVVTTSAAAEITAVEAHSVQ